MTKKKFPRFKRKDIMGKLEVDSQEIGVKKDSSDSPNTNYLGTQSTAGAENESGQMPVCVDNQHPPDNSQQSHNNQGGLQGRFPPADTYWIKALQYPSQRALHPRIAKFYQRYGFL